MFTCECGGILLVIAIEEPPELLSKEELIYNRVCDVECQNCGKILYSQPYDTATMLNGVRKTKRI